MKKNLHYFLYPLKGSIWDWNVAQLKPFLGGFNGTKLVVVAEDATTEPFDKVVRLFDDPKITFIRANNDPVRREVTTFIDMMRYLKSLDPSEITFYAHGKGVTHWSYKVANVMAWARAMYLLNLSRMDLIEKIMPSCAAAGAFRQVDLNGTSWHFSGTFFWLRHSEVYSRNWEDITQNPWGVEAYPGRHFRMEETFDLCLGRRFPDMYENAVDEKALRAILDDLPQVASSQGSQWSLK